MSFFFLLLSLVVTNVKTLKDFFFFFMSLQPSLWVTEHQRIGPAFSDICTAAAFPRGAPLTRWRVRQPEKNTFSFSGETEKKKKIKEDEGCECGPRTQIEFLIQRSFLGMFSDNRKRNGDGVKHPLCPETHFSGVIKPPGAAFSRHQLRFRFYFSFMGEKKKKCKF